MFDVWKNVLAEVEQEIPHAAFSTWFTGVTLISVEDGVVTVGVPNVLKVKQLEVKYNDSVKTALRNNGVDFKEVRYIVHTRAKTKPKSREVTGEPITIKKKKLSIPKRKSGEFQTGLNPRYTLDNFVIGSNNDLAVSVAKSVVENPGKKANPFFLYSGPGLGKTHLVQAIGNALLARDPSLKILYIPISHFYSDFINSIQNKTSEEFTKKFRKLDVLIVDDFQFIVGKDRSQEEFFHIFNDLYQLNKQIIVTSDRLPSQIKTVDERLASRLTWGNAIDLQMPSFEDKCAILKSKAEFMGAEIEDEAVEYLADNVRTNIRDLEGELNHLLAIADLKNITPLEVINDGYINTVKTPHMQTLSPKKILEKTAKYYDLTVKEMCSKSRVSHIKNARQVAMYLLSEELEMSTPKIAREVGVKDHTTVMHGIKKIKNDLKLNFNLREQIAGIRERLYE
ncbi:chromosomal replication initiator protein DnaA [Candidatus Saccharibacteria bacterium]|nr:chromosomal replication initiator protein DnaA [Candidatus Saccharibacteria bacterium]